MGVKLTPEGVNKRIENSKERPFVATVQENQYHYHSLIAVC